MKKIPVELTESEIELLRYACDTLRMKSGEFNLTERTANKFAELEKKLENLFGFIVE